jgi:hypothetical protein
MQRTVKEELTVSRTTQVMFRVPSYVVGARTPVARSAVLSLETPGGMGIPSAVSSAADSALTPSAYVVYMIIRKTKTQMSGSE